MAQCEMVEYNDDELVSSYFELDQASVPFSNSPGGYSDPGMFEENIPGFEPIKSRKGEGHRYKCEQDTQENFSGGIGCYVWPWSSQVSYSKIRPKKQIYKGLGIKKREFYREKMRRGGIKPYKYQESSLPSKYSGIDWKKELRQVYRPPR
ncbi:hypothetical protein F4805DRAFT_460966 [Annulohypoxylon moriforme]|nr:hypothetical protein F4805DRAFT_460966 [Annulohypoxylon moriforme]